MFRDKRCDIVFVGGRKEAVFADISMSTREPNEVAASVHDQREDLRWSTKAERNGVASIAVGKEWCGGGLGFFEVMGSC